MTPRDGARAPHAPQVDAVRRAARTPRVARAFRADPALGQLTPSAPLLDVRTLVHPLRKRVFNALNKHRDRATQVDDDAWPVRIGGLGRAGHAHWITRRDLVPWAHAAMLAMHAQRLTEWATAECWQGLRSPACLPPALLPTVALRRTWALGRALTTVLDTIDALADVDDRKPAAVIQALRRCLVTEFCAWHERLPHVGVPSTMHSVEQVGRRIAQW